MISVCYLSSCRRRRARSRWCWAPAPGGCWMWLGRERKTTKTTAWCTAKVSERRWRPVISLQRNTPRHSTAAHWQSSIHSSPPCLFLSFFLALLVSQSQRCTNNCSCKDTQKTDRAFPHTISVLLQRVIYIAKTLIRNWETSLDTQS